MSKLEMNEVERLVDKYGLTELVGSIAAVCGEKADHVRENWQDDKLADKWTKAAKQNSKSVRTSSP